MRRVWDPRKHPRDRTGRFTDTFQVAAAGMLTPADRPALRAPDDWMQRWARTARTRHPGIDLIVSRPAHRGDVVVVELVRLPAPKRGAGNGTRAMRSLLSAADRNHTTVFLSPGKVRGERGWRAAWARQAVGLGKVWPADVDRLRRQVRFYTRLGFVANDDPDPEMGAMLMVRRPHPAGPVDRITEVPDAEPDLPALRRLMARAQAWTAATEPDERALTRQEHADAVQLQDATGSLGRRPQTNVDLRNLLRLAREHLAGLRRPTPPQQGRVENWDSFQTDVEGGDDPAVLPWRQPRPPEPEHAADAADAADRLTGFDHQDDASAYLRTLTRPTLRALAFHNNLDIGGNRQELERRLIDQWRAARVHDQRARRLAGGGDEDAGRRFDADGGLTAWIDLSGRYRAMLDRPRTWDPQDLALQVRARLGDTGPQPWTLAEHLALADRAEQAEVDADPGGVYRVVLNAYDSRSRTPGARVVTYTQGHNREAALARLSAIHIAANGQVNDAIHPWPGSNNLPAGPHQPRALREWEIESVEPVVTHGQARVLRPDEDPAMVERIEQDLAAAIQDDADYLNDMFENPSDQVRQVLRRALVAAGQTPPLPASRDEAVALLDRLRRRHLSPGPAEDSRRPEPPPVLGERTRRPVPGDEEAADRFARDASALLLYTVNADEARDYLGGLSTAALRGIAALNHVDGDGSRAAVLRRLVDDRHPPDPVDYITAGGGAGEGAVGRARQARHEMRRLGDRNVGIGPDFQRRPTDTDPVADAARAAADIERAETALSHIIYLDDEDDGYLDGTGRLPTPRVGKILNEAMAAAGWSGPPPRTRPELIYLLQAVHDKRVAAGGGRDPHGAAIASMGDGHLSKAFDRVLRIVATAGADHDIPAMLRGTDPYPHPRVGHLRRLALELQRRIGDPYPPPRTLDAFRRLGRRAERHLDTTGH